MGVSHQSSSPSIVYAAVCLVTPKDFKTSFRFTVGGDVPYEILPTAIVNAYHAFLLQVAASALDVRHRFW